MHISGFLTGLFMAILGAFMVYKAKSRPFYRRNFAGIEDFKSYGHSVIIRILEKIMLFVGVMLLLGGLGCLIGAFL